MVSGDLPNLVKRPRVWAEIDLEAISSNLAVIRRHLAEKARIMLVAKADAYGHGAVAVARHTLARDEVQAFGLGDAEEALELRNAGIDAPLLILGAIVDSEMEAVIQNDIAICVHSESRVQRLAREARRIGRRARVHVMVDTGMGRLGPFPEKALEVAEAVCGNDWLELEGVATHFSSASKAHDPFTVEQMRRFDEFKRRLIDRGVPEPVFHAANSGAVLFEDCTGYDLVRVGAGAYGLFSAPASAADELRPALSLYTQVVYLKDVPSGTPISYNRMHVTQRKTRIATLPIGYNDGLRYGLSNKWHVLIRGRKVPIVGAVSMDYVMVDVGDVPGVRAGDLATLIGSDGTQAITVPEIAAALGSVAYEVTCGLGKRVHRLHYPQRFRPSLAGAPRRARGAAPEAAERAASAPAPAVQPSGG